MGGDDEFIDDDDIPEVPLHYLDPAGQAEARAQLAALAGEAITACRQRGEERPVVLEVHNAELPARRMAERIKPGLHVATAVPHPDPDVAVYVMTRAEARAALELGVGKQARRLFRAATFPTSYYVARITGRGLEWYEGRTWWDIAADQGRGR